MGDLVFFFGGELGHGLAQFGKVEDGVIPKAPVPHRPVGQNAGALTPRRQLLSVREAAADDAGITPDMSNEDISAAMSASMLNITLDGLTGEAKWTEDGECDKAPKAYVIKDGVYASME